MGSTAVISALLGLAAACLLLENQGYKRLDRFPGPFLARWTNMYRMYYDLVKGGGGEWVEQLQKLHEAYGTVVRVGPNELHFSSPEAYNEIYAVGSKFDKDQRTYNPISSNGHVFAKIDAHEAMVRRAMVLPYFSRRSLFDREWVIKQKVDNFVGMLIHTHSGDNSPLDLQETLRVFLGAIPPAVCFPDMEQSTSLASTELLSRVTEVPPGLFPWLRIKNLPRKVVQALQYLLNTRDIRIGQFSRLEELKAYDILVDDAMNTPLSDIEERNENLCHSLLKRSINNRPEPTRDWLRAEALNVKYAGIDTTSTAAFMIIRAVMSDDTIHTSLAKELIDVWPDLSGVAPGIVVLEKLPYLVGYDLDCFYVVGAQ
ncbi:hypothetical protein PQX77_016142 [Marasmius sp. AFHP31]|nr:hypothetical protein PQX77_016142 [Marasmius sp. AFHP31]